MVKRFRSIEYENVPVSLNVVSVTGGALLIHRTVKLRLTLPLRSKVIESASTVYRCPPPSAAMAGSGAPLMLSRT
jgi:hypothetical protein